MSVVAPLFHGSPSDWGISVWPSRFELSSDVLVAVWIAICLAGLVGWCLNVYKLIRVCCELDGWLALRALGVLIPPLGSVIGFF